MPPPPDEVVEFLLEGVKPRTRYLYVLAYERFLAHSSITNEGFRRLSGALGSSRGFSEALGVPSGVLEWFQKLSKVKTTQMLNIQYKDA